MTDPTADAAHAVRPLPQPISDPLWAATPALDPFDTAQDRLLLALRREPLRDFDVVVTAVVAGPAVDGRVVAHVNGENFPLTIMEASVAAILLRLEPADGPNAGALDRVADALCLGARLAGDKVDAIHAWSQSIRPTDEAEG